MAKLKKSSTRKMKNDGTLFKSKTQAKSAAKMASAQAKLIKSQAKSNVLSARQGRMKERHKTLRIAAISNAVASPWNNIINNSNNTGNYQTGTIGETPKENSNTSWTPRG